MKPDGIDDHADSIRFFLWIPDSFPPKRISIRFTDQFPDSSLQIGFPSGLQIYFRTVPKIFLFHPFCYPDRL